MKFRASVLELHLPQNFCHTHTQTHRQADIFQKQSNRVQDIPKCVNPSKTGNRNFARNQKLIQKKVKILFRDLSQSQGLMYIDPHQKVEVKFKQLQRRHFDFFKNKELFYTHNINKVIMYFISNELTRSSLVKIL